MSGDREDLEAGLVDPCPEVRRLSVTALGRLPLADRAGQVLRALGDDDWRVRKEMAAQLIRSPSGAALEGALIEAAIQVDNIGLRNAAAEVLAWLGGSAITGLEARLSGLPPSGRIAACEVIGRSRDPRAAGILVRLLDDPEPNVRACAAEWLGGHGGEAATEALAARLSGEDRLLILAALQSLNGLGARLPCAALIPLADDQMLAAEALTALGRCGDPDAASAVAARLGSEPAAARALETLHDTGGETAAECERVLAAAPDERLDALAALAREGEPDRQRAALRCLLWSGRTEFVPLFVELARDESLHPVLLEGLEAWGPAAAAALEDLLPRIGNRKLASAIGLLARLTRPASDRDDTARFAAYLDADEPMVATAAAGLIARLGDSRAVPRLIEMAGHEQARVRRAAGYALAEIGRREPAAVRAAVIALEIEGGRGVELCRALEVVGRAAPRGAARAGTCRRSSGSGWSSG